jgi:hypothetical protein
VRNKIDNYKQERNELRRRYENITLEYQKRLLMKRPSSKGGADGYSNMRMLEDLNERTHNIDQTFGEAAAIIGNTRNEVYRQREDLEGLHREYEDADVELSMIDQFMRTISNRSLLTKLILVALALFLGLADLTILILKIA